MHAIVDQLLRISASESSKGCDNAGEVLLPPPHSAGSFCGTRQYTDGMRSRTLITKTMTTHRLVQEAQIAHDDREGLPIMHSDKLIWEHAIRVGHRNRPLQGFRVSAPS